MDSESRTTIFLHMPKAGGTTLNRIINHHSVRSRRFIFDGRNPRKSFEHFKGLSKTQRQRYTYITGHMPYGVHDFLSGPFTYFTVLRDPVERVISHYYYVLRQPDHYLYREVKNKKLSLAELVKSGITEETENGMLRYLLRYEERPEGACGPAELDLAKSRLEKHFCVVGLVERFDETLILLYRKLGWTMPYYVKKNVTAGRTEQRELTEDTIDIIRKYNDLDIQLYEYASRRFQNEIDEGAVSFQRTLELFRSRNRHYGRVKATILGALDRLRKRST